MLMETPSKANKLLKLLFSYFKGRALLSIVAAYMVGSALLLAFTGIDICVPCLWTTIFGMHCPGCGLTTASIHLIHFDLVGAWEKNPLVFVVLPAGAFFIGSDFYRFLKKYKPAAALS